MNEHEEYLSVFPKDAEMFAPWIHARNIVENSVNAVYGFFRGMESQKEFALEAIKYPYQGILFNMRKGLTFQESWDKLSTDNKISLLKHYMKKCID